MSKARRSFNALATRIRWVMGVKIMVSLVVLVSAASITITTKNYQAEIGSSVTVANGLLATDKGFSPAAVGSSAVGTSCSSHTLLSERFQELPIR